MERQVQLSVEQLIQRMRAEFEKTMRQVGDAVNQAPDGQWINGSEMQVLEAMTEFQRKTFETALQMRIDMLEGTFSPGGPADSRPEAEQGSGRALDAEHQRTGAVATAALSQSRRGQRHARR